MKIKTHKKNITYIMLPLIFFSIILVLIIEGNDHVAPENKNKVLMKSIKEGDSKKVISLIENGANINYQDSDGYTPLMLSSTSAYQNKDIVQYLLKQTGINIDIRNKKKQKALDFAQELDDPEISRLLHAKSRDFSYIIYSTIMFPSSL
jgi:ankyrin repeat protein